MSATDAARGSRKLDRNAHDRLALALATVVALLAAAMLSSVGYGAGGFFLAGFSVMYLRKHTPLWLLLFTLSLAWSGLLLVAEPGLMGVEIDKGTVQSTRF